jgi:hypothetical protein
MKKLLLALLLVSMCASSPSAKVLIITSNSASIAGNNSIYLYAIFDRMHKTLGFSYDQVLATDTTAVWTMANSGLYSCAIAVVLPDLVDGTFDTEAELAAAGYPYLSMYINRNSAKAFPIPLIMPLPTTLVTSNCWATAYTGQVGQSATATTACLPLTDADGDSIYANCHGDGETRARIADSLSWCDPMVWQDVVVGASTQKYAHIWRTVGSGNHQVVYIVNAPMSYMQFLFAGVIGMFEKVTPVDLSICADEYGYVAASYAYGNNAFGTTVDTVSFAYNLHRISDYIVANGMKVDFLVSGYQMRTQNKANILTLPTLCAAYPANLRMTHKTDYSWNTTTAKDWLGFSDAGTYSQMVKRISRSIDSTSLYYSVAENRLSAQCMSYSGSSWVKTDSVLNAIVDCGVDEIYVVNNSRLGTAMPNSPVYGLIRPGKTWIGESHNEIKCYPIGGNSSQGGSGITATIDSARIYYLPSATYMAARGLGSATHSKVNLGEYIIYGSSSYSYSSLSAGVRKAMRVSGYTPGFAISSGLITGGSRGKGYLPHHYATADSTQSMFLYFLQEYNNHLKMANNLATRYGTSNSPTFVWSWLNEVKLDRHLGRAFVNSHVRHE